MIDDRTRKNLGREGETLAVQYLQKKRYVIKARNFRTILGEIDIVAEEHGVLHFIEVKTRSSAWLGRPEEAVDNYKLDKLYQAIYSYLGQFRLDSDVPFQVDVVTIEFNRNGFYNLEFLENVSVD